MISLLLNKSGFSLIEIIIVLIIAGLLGLVGSFGITSSVKSNLLQQQNAETAYNGQMAMIRISKEFKNLTSVTSGQGTATSIEYDVYRNAVRQTHKLSWNGIPGTYLLYYDDVSNNGNILVDQVKNFKLEYYDSNDTSPKPIWSSSTIKIGVTLELIGADNISSVFTGKITPRNLP
ncbi:prepilin-type N-terminal cleavage/methylation domain-containing protein [Desulfobacula toluolica]|uniref:Uncharacterized protein containing N-terminal methylation motif n=1 Tax=Desulfobacula toluolica (strain DSM 7467 / Tol2) TaxID=651182 RepID=K0N450_DESTT|nr:prepilin-type N-terminal cleavage/methylation domain-containing protein [Desulfobacula toluolica]CCK78879.1 uncharacterized protein containing N-terminal methylation motif, precursor [Desulfobacula toluolica Tol2]